MVGHFTFRTAGDEADNPKPAPRIFHQDGIAKRVGLRRNDGFQYLLASAIDGAHNRHAVQDRFTKTNQPAPQKACGDCSNEGDQDQPDDEPGTRNIGKDKLIETGKDACHLPVNQLDGRPGYIDRQQNRRGDQKTGQEPGSEAPQETGFPGRGLGVNFGHRAFLKVQAEQG